jgi:hypothetical protein
MSALGCIWEPKWQPNLHDTIAANVKKNTFCNAFARKGCPTLLYFYLEIRAQGLCCYQCFVFLVLFILCLFSSPKDLMFEIVWFLDGSGNQMAGSLVG